MIAATSLLLCGQACQYAYQQGSAYGVAYGMEQVDQQQYDRGYATAVSDYQEGWASWA